MSGNNSHNFDLQPHHLAMLREESGISDEVIVARGYRTVTNRDELRKLGFANIQCQVPGLLLPVQTTDGQNSLYVFRPDNPRVVENRRKKLSDGTYQQRVIKYEIPKGAGVRLDCPRQCQPRLTDPADPLWFGEGQKKVDALASRGACAVALLGVWNFKGKNDFGGTTLLADFDYIALNGREVYIVFDNDVMTKPSVQQALKRLTEHLQRKGAIVKHVYLPMVNGKKMGVDDWLVAHPDKTLADLQALAEGPRPEIKAAPPMIELLDEAPAMMSRPLALIAGRAYVATWVYVRVTQTESVIKGEIVRHDPPIEVVEQRPFILRDDGVIFGEGAGDTSYRPLREAGIIVKLPEMPQADRLLSPKGFKGYVGGERPNPVDVFTRVTAVVNRFIDFYRSLASQEVMIEMVACFIIATWFLEAWGVAANLWANGDRGSGKTKLLVVICELSFLGKAILGGSSFAALRDMADYGATLGFDDAENLADPRKTDPDKRALLLAGNRRDNSVSLKENVGRNQWVTRHVSTFAFRGYSAIKQPDPVLASRTIVVPLIRTPDRERANVDPSDPDAWPCERRRLLDDLWCLGLAYLATLKPYEKRVNEMSALTGRNLEPWRALLAVALWLDEQGVNGLWQRMQQVSLDYQNERPELEYGDFQVFIIQGLLQYCANCASCANCANHFEQVGDKQHWLFTSSQLGEVVAEIVNSSDSFIDTEKRFSQRVGMALGKMRLYKPPRAGGKGARQWLITLPDLYRWANSYGIVVPDALPPLPSEVGTVGDVGTVGTDKDDLLRGVL